MINSRIYWCKILFNSIKKIFYFIMCFHTCIKELKIGDLVSVIPVHSCLTVDKMKEMYVGNNKILQMIENRDSAIYDYHKYFRQYTIKKVRWKSLVN